MLPLVDTWVASGSTPPNAANGARTGSSRQKMGNRVLGTAWQNSGAFRCRIVQDQPFFKQSSLLIHQLCSILYSTCIAFLPV